MRRHRWTDLVGLLLIVSGLGIAFAEHLALDDRQQQVNRQWERERLAASPIGAAGRAR